MAKLPHFIHNTDIGQNFLVDRSVVDYMLRRAALTPDDYVLEVGPGEGILTEGLLASDCAGVCTLELDTRLRHVIETLERRNPKLTALWGDAVQFDYENGLPRFPNRVIANLPYHITTPLLWAFLEKLVPNGLDYLLLMVQLESAQRVVSPPRSRDRSPLGVTMEAMGASRIVKRIPPTVFRPMPRVNSCLLEIRIEGRRDLACNDSWRALLARSFAQRRKTLSNNWLSGYGGMTRELVAEILERCGLNRSARAEELSLDDWFALLREPAFQMGRCNSEEAR
jgi:16S rRNA (adenine1518-N6/adenine1519-N6)-dimethyltransferase